ncbi:MAG: hypothetical protein RL571_543 [Pseudomonadota bacterium]|jgi:hypothetical protein
MNSALLFLNGFLAVLIRVLSVYRSVLGFLHLAFGYLKDAYVSGTYQQ